MMMPEAYNIDTDRFDELFDNFKSELGHYEVGVLYFSGHGVEIDGKNYLIMRNTPIGELAKATIRYSIDLQGPLPREWEGPASEALREDGAKRKSVRKSMPLRGSHCGCSVEELAAL